MASVSNVSSSSANSIYGSRNVISGLASGMDTETMIENAVSGIQAKITALQQKRTKVEWQQTAYRNIIDKILNFTNAYSSYSSSLNLSSPSFFRNASLITTSGKYADKVSATGKTASSVQLLGVKQLAKAATYSVSGIGGKTTDAPTIVGKEPLNLSEKMDVSTISGILTLNYGGNRSYSVDLGELDVCKTADELAAKISEQLDQQNMTLSDGSTVTAGSRIGVRVDYDNGIEFYDKAGAGNNVYISSVSGDIAKTLNISASKTTNYIAVGDKALYEEKTRAEYLEDHPLKVTLDGTTRTISLEGKLGSGDLDQMMDTLQSEFDKAFGRGKISVYEDDGVLSFEAAAGSTMSIQGAKEMGLASDLETSYLDTSKRLGDILGDDVWSGFDKVAAEGKVTKVEAEGATAAYYKDEKDNRVAQDTDGKWYRVDDQDDFVYKFEMNGHSVGNFSKNSLMENVTVAINNNTDVGVNVSYSKITNQFQFVAEETGSNHGIEFGDGLASALFGAPAGGHSDNFSEAYGLNLAPGATKRITFELPGFTTSFTVNSDTTMEGIAQKLSGGMFAASGYNAAYNQNTGQLMLTDESGKLLDFKVTADGAELDPPELAAHYTPGQDAIFSMTVNGVDYDGITRSSNTFDVDGMSISLKGTFGEYGSGNAMGDDNLKAAKNSDESVSFTYSADTGKIVDAIKAMVNDYNALVAEIHDAYSTMPAQKSNGSRYEPLTDDDIASMSESAVKAYEEKAKQGLLFADRDLSNLYSKLTSLISPAGQDGADMRSIGLEKAYSNGLTTIQLDETKLRQALATNPDKVADVFTKTVDNGASSNGLMASLQSTLNVYAKSTGLDKGILVEKAGSAKVPASIYQNQLQTRMDEFDTQIQKWQDKLSDRVDYYTRQFTLLEQMISEMNSQSSTLMGLMGTGTGG